VIGGRVGQWTVDDEDGDEPDYRFTLANERTFLAWIRTALALLAGGVAVRQVAEPFDVPGGRRVLAMAAIVSSVTLIVLAYRHWVLVQQAMRRGEPLPRPSAIPVLAAALVLIAAVATVLVLT
jgi:putative membrane protein